VDMLTWANIDAVTAAQEAIMAKDEIQTYYGMQPLGKAGSLDPSKATEQYSRVNGWPG